MPDKNPIKPNINKNTAFIYNTVAQEIANAKANGKLDKGEDINIDGVVAQILLESNNGTSNFAKNANNFGGIKADSNWKGPTLNGYRKYSTPEEGLKEQVNFYLDNPRYKANGVFNANTPEEHFKAVQKAGYAQDKEYVKKGLQMVKSIPNRLAKAENQSVNDISINRQLEPVNSLPVRNFTELPKIDIPFQNYDPVGINSKVDMKVPYTDINIPQTNNSFTGQNTIFKEGGSIHIDPSKKGTFTTAAKKHHKSVQEFASQVLSNKQNYSSAMVKKANFAKNASKFHHEYGGKLFAEGGSMEQSQLTQFNNGGTHEENPNGGIPQGMNPNGQQNMVEQGETKLNTKDYIFSNSLKVDKSTVNDFYFPSKYIGKTFAEVSKLMERPDSRRKYDTIEENAKKKDLDALMNAQEIFKQKELEKDMNKMLIKHPDFMSSIMAQQPQEQSLNSSSIENQQVSPEVPVQSPIAKMGGYQNHYDFGGNLKDITKNFGLGLADTALGIVGAPNVIQDSNYSGKGSQFAQGYSNIAGQIGKTVLPMAANIIAPGSGALISAGQQQIGKLNPNEEQAINSPISINGLPNMMATGGPLYPSLSFIGPTDEQLQGEYFSDPTIDLNNTQSADKSLGILQSDQSQPSQNVQSWDPNLSFASQAMVDSSKVPSAEKDYNYVNPAIPGGPQPQNVNQTALNALGTYAPVAYNIGMGLFGKVQKLDDKNYINNKQLTNWRNNINPQLKSSDEAFAAAQAGIKGSGTGGGNYLANLSALHNQQEMSKAGIQANAENEYNNRQLQIDQINAARGDQNAQMRLQIAQYNAQAKAAKTRTLQEGIKQVGQISQADTSNKLATAYNNLVSPDFQNFAKYSNYLESLKNKK